MKSLWCCEWDRQAKDVLRFHHPDLPIYPDVRTFPADEVEVPDVLWMSPPCQDLSVAGKRAGLAGERSGLFYDAVRIAARLRDRGTKWILMEQVPGLFSSNGGEDVRQALVELSDLGLSLAWRVLDSQWFGVPQRRRRAFFVVDLRGERAGEVLALAQGLRGDSPPSREKGQRVAASLTAGSHPGSNAPGRRREDDVNLVQSVAGTLGGGSGARGFNNSLDVCGAFIPFDPHQITSPDNRSSCAPGDMLRLDATAETLIPHTAHTLRAEGFDASEDGTGRGTPLVPVFGLDADYNGNEELVNAMKANGQGAIRNGAVAQQMAVRRLTPGECCALQGWPRDWNKYGRKEDGTVYELADGPRYKQCGNGVTANVSEWIARNLIAQELTEVPNEL